MKLITKLGEVRIVDHRRKKGMHRSKQYVLIYIMSPFLPLLRLKSENRVEFRSAADAIRAGYRKARDCR